MGLEETLKTTPYLPSRRDAYVLTVLDIMFTILAVIKASIDLNMWWCFGSGSQPFNKSSVEYEANCILSQMTREERDMENFASLTIDFHIHDF